VISSRTPEGQPNGCPVCGKVVVMEPSQPFGDAPCPHCGCLLLFEPLGEGFRVSVAKRPAKAAGSGGAGSMYVCPQCKTRIPFGTETKPPPSRCPSCQRRLWIPTTLATLPGHTAGSVSG
jgi:DNA-directed RNA polymerase subunit RPC12/RpoP